MKCPECGGQDTIVIATIPVECVVWRRRLCRGCDNRWWTSECEDEPLHPIWGEKQHQTTISGVSVLQNPRE